MSRADSKNANTKRASRDDASGDVGRRYATVSAQPLHVLVFLLPLLALAELGSVLLAQQDQGVAQEILAHRLLSEFFAVFGVSSFHLPAIALVVVLLVQHVLSRHRWNIQPMVLLGMAVESVLWVLPLLVLAQMLIVAQTSGALQEGAVGVRELPWLSRATIALGAGLYEELLFRFVAITILHLVLVDLLRIKKVTGSVLAIVLAALAFALYHSQVAGFVFFLLAGLYFGALFVWRGFGIVVAVHAVYDLVALLGPGAAG